MNVSERKEAVGWDNLHLNNCPCCGSKASIVVLKTQDVIIACSKKGCKIVSGKEIEPTIKEWNEPRFTQRHD